MEFPFDINVLFPDRITVLDQNLTTGRKFLGRPDHQHQIATVIDELGKASAKAQDLAAPITSAEKLQSNRHFLYLLKNGEGNGGRGVAVGYLKVGFKNLFLLDQWGAHVETEPLCVLDFFIAERMQRHGYGLELFRSMLRNKRADPVQLAYDRPSPKFLSFLEKHCGLKDGVPQVNNFVVFDGFFRNHSAVPVRKVPPKKPEGEIKPYSLTEREALREEQKALPWPFARPQAPPHSPPLSQNSAYSRSLSVGSSPTRAPLRLTPASGAYRGQAPQNQLIDGVNYRARRTREQGLVARGNHCSRRLDDGGCGLPPEGLPPEGLPPEGRPNILKLPGLQPVQRGGEADIGLREPTSGHTDIRRKDSRYTQTPLAPGERTRSKEARQPDGEGGVAKEKRSTPGQSDVLGWRWAGHMGGTNEGTVGVWSWTVGEGPYTAQWIRRKQEYRSTRPW
ncbi:alpha-tubulin N-acetyltransferase 1 isoform X2 [Brienomyrus brachyistius]|uniref:alpha-tubulin N-acetyltransferase 1 isoform X2 n=1 Tax=Brienomyrus brachyistius TaxID=42636 RepID=UPI0020B3BDDB|nr:alpha-tubulin N-acetyltransferase 1 isoform X2 [Brienomyrus brachyistius]